MFTLKDNTIFIADSHFSHKREILVEFLNKIINKNIICDQLILMGDIFDFLSQEITFFINENQAIIDILNKLSYQIDIIYFEGNHDFNLENLFPNILIIPREFQPVKLVYNNKIIKLSHGDIYTPMLYNIYTKIIRNKILLWIINKIDIKFWITKQILIMLDKKNICKKYDNFDTLIAKRVSKYNCDLIIEGHYHQNIFSDNYINIPSLFCDKEYLYLYKNKFSIRLI